MTTYSPTGASDRALLNYANDNARAERHADTSWLGRRRSQRKSRARRRLTRHSDSHR